MPSLPGLSCPGVGNYEDDSVVHFVMLSLTYEFWAIFQNFSQGGYLHLQGLGGMQPGSQGWCLSASNEPARRHTKKYFLLHATFISVLGLFGLEGLPVIVLVSSFVFFLLLATYCKFSLTKAYSCALLKTCLQLCAVSWLRLRRVVNDRPQRFLIDGVLLSSGLACKVDLADGLEANMSSNQTRRICVHLSLSHASFQRLPNPAGTEVTRPPG